MLVKFQFSAFDVSQILVFSVEMDLDWNKLQLTGLEQLWRQEQVAGLRRWEQPNG